MLLCDLLKAMTMTSTLDTTQQPMHVAVTLLPTGIAQAVSRHMSMNTMHVCHLLHQSNHLSSQVVQDDCNHSACKQATRGASGDRQLLKRHEQVIMLQPLRTAAGLPLSRLSTAALLLAALQTLLTCMEHGQ